MKVFRDNVAAVLGNTDIMDGDNVRVTQACDLASFVQKCCFQIRLGVCGFHRQAGNLHSDFTVEAFVEGLVNRAIAAFPDCLRDRVAPNVSGLIPVRVLEILSCRRIRFGLFEGFREVGELLRWNVFQAPGD